MSWNHRVVKDNDERLDDSMFHGDFYSIREVFYDDISGDIKFFSQELSEPCGETIDILREDLERMLRALDKPVLELVDGKLVEIAQ